MATLPDASVTIDNTASAPAGGVDRLVVLACVAQNADIVPREFASSAALLAKHAYTPGIDYCAMHFDETKKPVIFVGLPSVTAGAISQQDASGVTGSSAVAAVADTGGVQEGVDGILTITGGGTIGTAQILATLSLDGGFTTKTIRIGTASNYAIPYVGIKLTFAAGTLAVNDVFRFKSTAPRWDQAGLLAARKALAAQLKQARSWLIIGDLVAAQDATDVLTEANNYETANDRFIVARTQARDNYLPAKMTGTPTLTFASPANTITRSAGSWITDGFKVGMSVSVTGATNGGNNVVNSSITNVTATVLTVSATLVAEGPTSNCKATAVELDADWATAVGSTFATIDAQKRIDIGAGYGRKNSPITGWAFRRPVSWAASIREYQHDVQIPTFRKADGPCSGWSLQDVSGNIVEHDERVNSGLLSNRFTCFRSYANGPAGAFIGLSLTRDTEGSLLSRTHNMAVANVACTVVHAETENAIGQVLELNDDGTATEASLVVLEERVNSALAIALLQAGTEGARASAAKWRASRTDILNIPEATLTGTLDLQLNGTLEKISTRVRVQTAG